MVLSRINAIWENILTHLIKIHVKHTFAIVTINPVVIIQILFIKYILKLFFLLVIFLYIIYSISNFQKLSNLNLKYNKLFIDNIKIYLI